MPTPANHWRTGAAGANAGPYTTPIIIGYIVAATGSRKRDPRTAVGWDVGSTLMQRAVVAMMRHQRFINLLLSNVPGPTRPLRVAGAPVLEAFQIAPIQGNVTIGVGALSYAGQLNLDVVTDTRACPDALVFADGLAQELDALGIARCARRERRD